MPKPMLRPQAQTQAATNLSTRPQQDRRSKQMDKMQMDRLLRKTRSKEYMEALHKLDSGGHVHNREKVNEIIDAIRNEFPEVELTDVLLGYVSVCYLGKPYEVHTLDMSGQIIEHYKAGEPLPGLMEKARSLALHGGYEFIEVYADCCRCVSSIGAVSVVSF